MTQIFLVIITIVLIFPCYSFAENERINRFEVEAGVLGTQNMEIHGYKQESATSNWDANFILLGQQRTIQCFSSDNTGNYLRLGGSVVARYAELKSAYFMPYASC